MITAITQIELEEWRDIEGYEGVYQVSNQGRVRGLDRMVRGRRAPRIARGRVLRPGTTDRDYLMVSLCREGKCASKRVNRLVLLAFVDPVPGKPECNHIDTVKANNRAGNLEWSTRKENMRHAYANGLVPRPAQDGERNNNSKLTASIVQEMRELYATGKHTQKQLGLQFGISSSHVSDVLRGRRWPNAGGPLKPRRFPWWQQQKT